MKKLLKKIDDRILEHAEDKQNIPIIIKLAGGLTDMDKEAVKNLGGKVKNNLYVLDSFTAELPISGIKLLVLNPRVQKIFYDSE